MTCQLEVLAQAVAVQAQVLSRSWHDGKENGLSSCDGHRIAVPTLDTEGEEARNQLLLAIRSLEQMVLGPKDTVQSFYFKSAEAGVVQALCHLRVPRYVPLYGSISYSELSKKVAVSADRLKHLIRIAAVCSNFLAETSDGRVTHSENSLIWQLDPLTATGMEVMLDHLPPSSFKLGEVCSRDPLDEKQEVCGFSLARDQPLYSYLEENPEEGRNFAAHMRAQAAQHGDSAIQQGYDWNSLKGKTIVDCGGSFGSVAAAIVDKEPTIKCIVQDLPKVVDSAIRMTAKDTKFPHDKVTFQAQSFLEPQPVVADVYLFRMVFHNWSDVGARRILQSLRPALRPGSRVICIEYVMPPIGSGPTYAEIATRRLDNVMYSLMKGKVRELTEFKDLFKAVEPDLIFTSFKQGQLRATHDPRCHSVLEWVYNPKIIVPDGPGPAEIDSVISSDDLAEPDGAVSTDDVAETNGIASTNDVAVAETSVAASTNDTPETNGVASNHDLASTNGVTETNGSAPPNEIEDSTNGVAETNGEISPVSKYQEG